MYKIGPNKFMGGGGVCGRGEKGGAFCSVCIFHNQKMHVYLIYFCLFNTVDNKQMFNKILPMTGVEPRTSGIESDRSTN